MPDFVHLHVHSDMSVGKGISSTKMLVDKAVSLGMKALALTDHNRMINTDSFLAYAKNRGIKPIVGLEINVTEEVLMHASGHMVFLAANKEGFDNLKRISSLSFHKKDAVNKEPFVTSDILSKYHQGIIALSGCEHGLIPSLIVDGDFTSAKKIAQFYEEIFKDRFYYEIMRHGIPMQEVINNALFQIASPDKLVVTNNVRFINEDDAWTYLLVSRLSKRQDPAPEQWLKSAKEMEALFPDVPQALTNTLHIADMCNDLSQGMEKKQFFIHGLQINNIKEKVFEKLKEQGFLNNKEYLERVEKELSVIEQCGFMERFSIIADIVEYAQKHGIATGIGRGSACESLVCYLLGITKVNPTKWKSLLFERFLNPERISLPDIDLDIDAERRSELVEYICKKYGDEHVAGIAVVSAYRGKSAIKAAAAIMASDGEEIPERLLLSLSASVENLQKRSGKTIADLLRDGVFNSYTGKEGKKLYTCLLYAARLENLPNGFGIHPAGILIGDDLGATMLLKNEQLVVQREANDLENDQSLFKIDLLSSNVTSVIRHTLENIKKQGKDVPDINHLQLNNSKAYEFYGKGDAVGIFQMEGETAKNSAIQIRPKNFTELIAWTAITRPGAQKVFDTYIERAKKRKPISFYGLDEILKPVLDETLGLIIYQEQIMQIAVLVAGYDLAQADSLQHAVSKKNSVELEAHRHSFIDGAIRNGIQQKTAERLFADLQNFSGYGFNKAHAIAYAYTSYITAWLKAEYPLEFMQANLEHGAQSSLRTTQRIKWASERGYISLPDIFSSEKATVIRNNKILLGFSSIKGISEKAINDLIELRKTWHNDEPADLVDFLSRSPVFNKNFLVALNNAGAIDTFIGGADKRPVVAQYADKIVETAVKKRAGTYTVIEKDTKYPFLGIERIQPKNFDFFTQCPKEIVNSEDRIQIENMKADKNVFSSDGYILAKISDFTKNSDGSISCSLQDDSGKMSVKINAFDWQKISTQKCEEQTQLNFTEGRHKVIPDTDFATALKDKEQIFQIEVKPESFLSSNKKEIFVNSIEIIENPIYYTVIDFPNACDIKSAEEALDIITSKFSCEKNNGEVYYINYGNKMPPRAFVLQKTKEASDAMWRWKDKMNNSSLRMTKSM